MSYLFNVDMYYCELSQELDSRDSVHDIDLLTGDHILVYPSVLIDNSQFTYGTNFGNFSFEALFNLQWTNK